MSAIKEWIVWLSRGAGESFLGLEPASNGTNRRFCILGKMTAEAFGIGFWLEVDAVQEWAIPSNTVARQWTVSPKTCLIRWDFITHIQQRSGEEQVGFLQVSPKPK
jgi:hypothetical protein